MVACSGTDNMDWVRNVEGTLVDTNHSSSWDLVIHAIPGASTY